MWKQFNKPTDISAMLLSKWLWGAAEVIDGPGWFQQAGVSDLLTPQLMKTTQFNTAKRLTATYFTLKSDQILHII